MKAAVLPIDDLVQAFCAVRAHSEALAAPLSAEDCAVQSMPDASPVKWHLAHTSWFFESMILSDRPGYRPFDARFSYLFNSYYEGLGPRHPRPRRGVLTRPSLDDVLAYRAHVDAAMDAVLDDPGAFADAILLGLQHEQQHQELILTDIKHAFFANPLWPAYARDAPSPTPCGPGAWVEHPGGLTEIGYGGDSFSFDNETPRHSVMLHPFRIAGGPVSNAEFLAFIEDGGYTHAQFWLSEGW